MPIVYQEEMSLGIIGKISLCDVLPVADKIGKAEGVVVVDDYAHHEAEIAATLDAARQAYAGRRLIAAFQPHLFSRTAEHGVAMGQALSKADVVVVTDVYAAREQPMPGVTGKLVADAAKGTEVHYVPNRDLLAGELVSLARPGDVVLTMGAGDITWVGRELMGMLVGRRAART